MNHMMQQKNSQHRQGHRRFSRIFLITASLLTAVILAVFGNVGTGYATSLDSRPGGNVSDPVVRAVDIAKPAVVRILTSATATLVVHFQTPTGGANDVTFPQTAGKPYQVGTSGSGTFISSDGDILTADHVVQPDQAIQQTAAPDVTNYINQHKLGGDQTATVDQVAAALETGQLKSDITYASKQSEVYLSTDYTGPLSTGSNNVPPEIHATVDKIKKESAFDQKDVAIIHVPFTDTPSVQLGDSANVQQQDELTIIGFPGNADVNPNSLNDVLTLSINKIIVSAIKTTASGAKVIQVGGNVEHGDSGGPALDSNGNVVGVVSFGLNSPNSPGSTSFLQSSSSAQELITSLNLDTTPGAFQKLWSQSFNDYAATTQGHWHKAQTGFEAIAAKYPTFKEVTPFLEYTKQQALTEKLPVTPTPTKKNQTPAPSTIPGLPINISPMTLAIGAGAIVALLALSLFAVVIRGRRKKGKGVPMATGTANRGVNIPQPVHNANATAQGMTAFGAPPPAGQNFTSQFGQTQPAQRSAGPVPVAPPGMGQPNTPPRSLPTTPGTIQPVPQMGATGNFATDTLRVWPCGHMNRLNARFCSICGEPGPPTPQRPPAWRTGP